MKETELKPCDRCAYYNEDRDNQPCCSCFGQNFEDEKLLINNPKSNNSEDMSNKQIEKMLFDVVKAFNYARDFCAEQGGCDICENRKHGKNCDFASMAENLYNAGYRKQSEVMTEIIGTINKRIEINQYHLQGNNTDLFHGIYQGRYEAYRDIAEIIEQRYGAKMKGESNGTDD